MADDVYLIDVEVHFAHGDPLFEQLVEGRDQWRVSDQLIQVTIDAGDGVSVNYTIERANVNYTKVTRRKLEPEVKPGWE